MSEKWVEKQYSRTYLGAWREAAKASQEEMAAFVGISNGHLSKIELGRRQYTQEILEGAAAFLRTSFPAISAAALIDLSPTDAAAAELLDPEIGQLVAQVRRVPPVYRDAARRMLAGMIEPRVVEPAPPTKASAKPRGGIRRGTK